MDQKRRLTDFQRIVIYFSVITAVFLAAMGLGWQSLWLLLAGGVILVVAVASVIIVGARRNAAGNEIITARVLSVSAPPPNTGISARCDMQLEVHLPGRSPARMKHRDPSVSLTRWPHPGQTLPVEVRGGGAGTRRRLHVRWDLVELGVVRAPDSTQSPSSGAGASASQAPVWEDEQEPIIYSPTPPRPRRPQGAAAPPSAVPPTAAPPTAAPPTAAPPTAAPPPPVEVPGPAMGTGVFLHESFTDVDDQTIRTPSHPTVDQRDPARLVPNGHDPDGIDMADFETPHLATAPSGPAPPVAGEPEFDAMTFPDFDPADVDIRDFTGDPPAVTVMRPDDEPGSATPSTAPAAGARPTPSTTPPGDPQPAPSTAAPPQIPVPRDPGDTGPGGAASGGAASGGAASGGTESRGTESGVTRPVADLARSLTFYRDALGFTVASAEGPVAVVERQGTRVQLTQSDGDVRSAPGEIHLDVTDIEATCEAAKEHAGQVVEAPGPTTGGVGRQRRRARLRDPDGHAIVIQSRDTPAG